MAKWKSSSNNEIICNQLQLRQTPKDLSSQSNEQQEQLFRKKMVAWASTPIDKKISSGQ